MLKIISICLLIILTSVTRHSPNRVFTGFFSRMMTIDTTVDPCGEQTYALLYAFQSDSARSTPNKLFLYGLVKCPATFNQELFNHNNKLSISYRECTKEDVRDVVIMNRQKFFNVRYYLIIGIEEAQ